MISNRRIYLTEDGEAVEDGDPRSHTLLVGEGCQIHETLIKKHGLVFPEPEPPVQPLTESDLVAFRMELDAHAAELTQQQEDIAKQQEDIAKQQEAFAKEKEAFAMQQATPATETKAAAPADDKAVKAAPENKAVTGPAETK